MGLFETIDTTKVAMVVQIKDLFSSYNLLDKLITHLKDQGCNLSTLAQVFSSMVKCAPLALTILWQVSCFGHAFNKKCQYAYNDTNVYVGFWEVSLKATHSTLHKTITWTKKFGKGHNEWQKACFDVRISHQKMKTLVKTKFVNKVIIFQKTLEYWDTSIFIMGGKKLKIYKVMC